jgi:hypothetical protein
MFSSVGGGRWFSLSQTFTRIEVASEVGAVGVPENAPVKAPNLCARP